MRILGAALFACGQVLSVLVVCSLVPFCLLLPSLPRARVIGLWARFNIHGLRWFCGLTHRVRGLDNLPPGPCVLISNHQSAWETLCFQVIFPPQSYILKRQLLWIPVFGWGLAANRPIAIDRGQKRRALAAMLQQGRERLDEGRWVVVFPEGARMPPGRPGAFAAGGAMLAEKSGAKVVPVAHNAGVFWPKRSFLKYPGVIDVVVGEAIDPAGKSAREINRLAEVWITQQLAHLPRG